MMKGRMLVVFVLFVLCGYAAGKECTNTPTQLSHTDRYRLLTSGNETWKKEAYSHYHLTHTDEVTWSSLVPRKVLKENDEFSWAMLYKQMKNPDQFKAPGDFLKEVSLNDVRLDPSSMHFRAQQTNLEYLLMLDVDNLLWSFRKTAGLPTPGRPYGGWERADCELRGHFVGHYLSATAKMWASTHNDALMEKMSALLSGLSACQDKMGTGYLAAFPSEEFDRFEAIQPVWAPYYTIHKILAGLLDQYNYAGSTQALNMMTWMVDHFYNRVQNVVTKYSVERHYQSLNEETGGMNDVLYNLYIITKNPKHILLAHLFDKPCFLGLLAVQADDISGYHVNTHIPVVIGSQMRYEITGEPLYKEIGRYFMEIVNSSHSYATGGTSVSEFWRDPKRLATTLQRENEESCTTYNMLKVSRNLFRWTKDVAYADYYERALTNGVLSIQRGTDPGVMIYMLPLGQGVSKAVSYHGWGSQFNDFWCCYGTGIESFSKLGDSIYFEEQGAIPALYVIQYISSSLNWKSGQIMLSQKVDPVSSSDRYVRVTLTFSPKGTGQSSTINLRIPSWTDSNGAKVTLNGQSLNVPAPGNFLSVTSKWTSSDTLTLQLPISIRAEPIKDDRPEYASLQALLFGPYLLSAHSRGDWEINPGPYGSYSEWVTPIPSTENAYLASFSQDTGGKTFALTNSNVTATLSMEKFPRNGTDVALRATFKLILTENSSDFSAVEDAIGKQVMLEPFDYPGRVVMHQGAEGSFVTTDSKYAGKLSLFNLVKGLGGGKTVSIESVSNKGCFVYSGENYNSGTELKLKCSSGSSDSVFEKAVSFTMGDGLIRYHPISFVAKGDKRSYVMTPLLSFQDEVYTVYLNVTEGKASSLSIGD